MLSIAGNNEHHILDIYQLDFTTNLPAIKLPTQTLPAYQVDFTRK